MINLLNEKQGALSAMFYITIFSLVSGKKIEIDCHNKTHFSLPARQATS